MSAALSLPVRFSVVTVLYNSNAVLHDMVASLPEDVELILVDNGVDNGQDAPDLARLPAHVKYLKNPENLGFGRACNRGAREASGDFVFFLNPDARLRPGFFEALRAAMEAYPEASVFCGATYARGRLYLRDRTWIEMAATGEKAKKVRTPDLWGDCCIRFANGGAVALRRSLFEKIGGFDEKIFLYFEDDDLSCRLVQAGEPIILVHEARLDHVLGQSTPPSAALNFLRGHAKERSTRYLSAKYGLPVNGFGTVARILANIAFYTLTFNTRRRATQLGRLKAWREK